VVIIAIAISNAISEGANNGTPVAVEDHTMIPAELSSLSGRGYLGVVDDFESVWIPPG